MFEGASERVSLNTTEIATNTVCFHPGGRQADIVLYVAQVETLCISMGCCRRYVVKYIGIFSQEYVEEEEEIVDEMAV